MKVSILPLNSLWLYMERGLGFRIFCGLGGRVGGLGNDGQKEQKNTFCQTVEPNVCSKAGTKNSRQKSAVRNSSV